MEGEREMTEMRQRSPAQLSCFIFTSKEVIQIKYMGLLETHLIFDVIALSSPR